MTIVLGVFLQLLAAFDLSIVWPAHSGPSTLIIRAKPAEPIVSSCVPPRVAWRIGNRLVAPES
jgi:hypothetical protein